MRELAALEVNADTVYTVDVGAGGTFDPGNPGANYVGADSEVTGDDITTFTSTRGGRGSNTSSPTGASNLDGGAGGGGTGGQAHTFAGGSGNTPSTSPSQGAPGHAGNFPWGGGGGGGGASERSGTTAVTGGSGVIIVKLLTANYSGTTTGSPTVSVDGDYTILKYEADGTFTG
jgi:hypothetical protein